VLVSFEGEVKLCDFGIARALDREGDEDAVRRARVAGKSAYMAPEHARGDRVDPRSDLFAAGILLWELCAGRRLYRGDDEQMLALARAAEVPPLPNRNLPDAAGLQAVLDRALASWAIGAKLMASPLRFGAFLTEHFAEDIVSLRRARETAAAEIVDDADPSTFGPSSSPPPANGSRAASAPKPPKVPRDWMPPPPDELPYARTEELDALPPPPPPPKVAALSKSGAQKPKGDAAAGETTTSGSHKVPALSKSGAAKLAQLTKSDAARAAKVDAVKAKAEPPATPTSATPSSTTSPSSSSATPASSSAPSTGTPTSSAASTAPAASVASASGTPSATPSATSSATRVSGASATPSGPASLTSSSGPRSISIDVALDSGARATPSARVTAAKPPGALEAFSPAWLALVACGAVAFGFVVYFVVSALAR
jgi:serine/threonine protein kinase